MKLAAIRSAFVQYFSNLDHTVVKSSPLVPNNDPTLLFTNAGMVQFKDVFLGQDIRNYTKAVSVQRCLRAGGKHNDLENVGYTARHHTFFEMLGNFSFGDYFKREAITMAWKFLTEVIKLPAERLWVTVYEEDIEAEKIWLEELKIDPTRFSRCGKDDNYWSMGDTGPCGPCTEIFYDHGPDVPGGPPGSKDGDLDRYIEIWNLVFMQYDRDASGNLTPLPKPCVDTGMGIERLAAVVQGVHSNYEIDLFANLIKFAAQLTQTSDLNNQSLRVLADHIRACSFLIVDGVIPANEGRGYVLRRIIRRAIRHGNKLGTTEPFFYKMVTPLCAEMGDAYPEILSSQHIVEKVLKQEEQQFAKTLDQGLKILNAHLQTCDQNNKIIDGQLAFKLYDTYGFPIDLTMDIARENSYKVDIKGFEHELELQRQRSKQSSTFKNTDNSAAGLKQQNDIAQSLKDHATDFVGYEKLSELSVVTKILDQHSQEVISLKAGDVGYVVLEQTPFYAEGGGQVGDTGELSNENFSAAVENTIKIKSTYLHKVLVTHGSIKNNDQLTAQVNLIKRHRTARNHSATHLLHAALRKNLGESVMQKGSYVGPDYLRFDFAYYQSLTKEQLDVVENEVNEQILKNTLTNVKSMAIDDAIATGAVALFGEKYDSKVRVLNFGNGYSVELCGGTHVHATGDIGLFVITQETSVASGVRRIEALTGDTARLYLKQKEEQLKAVTSLLKIQPKDLVNKISDLQQDYNKALKEISNLKNNKISSSGKDLTSEAQNIAGIKILVKKINDLDAQQLRSTVDQLKSELNTAIIFLASENSDKVNLITGVTNNCTAKINAVDLINMVAAQLGGKGGGRPDLAQAGAKHPEKLDAALSSVLPWLKEQLQE